MRDATHASHLSTGKGVPVNSLTPTEWADLLKGVDVIFGRTVKGVMPTLEQRSEPLKYLVGIAAAIRLVAITHRSDIDDIWTNLRDNEELLTLILTVGSEVFAETGVAMDRAARGIAEGVYAMVPAKSEHSVDDENYFQSIGTEKTLVDLLLANPWFLVILLLRRAGTLDLDRYVEV